jgi:membrane protein
LLYRGWNQDSLGDTAAALTYYGMLSAFPFLFFAVTLAGLLIDESSITQIVSHAGRVMPEPVTHIIGQRLTGLQRNANGGLLTVGIVASLWAASGGMSSLAQALNRCYDVVETRPWWRTRANAIVVTIVAAIAGALAVAVMFFVPLLARKLGIWAGWLRFPVAGLVIVALWSFLYWALPNIRSRFQWVTAGSLSGALLWLAASWGFSEYVRHWGKYDAIYGALGGVIVFMVWMWISAAVLLLGAELNKVLTPAGRLQQAATGEVPQRHRETPAIAGPDQEPRPAT